MLELKVVHDDIEFELQFEHSLLSLSKWEQRTKLPFLTDRQKSPAEMLSYYEDMLVTPDVDPNLIYTMDPKQWEELTRYINTPQTASSVPDDGKKEFNPEVITSELIYYWFVAMKIPFHPTETWHISRAIMLVQITNFKNQPPKKRNPSQVMADWRAQNERNKQILGIKD